MLSSAPIHKPRPLLDVGTLAFWASLLVVLLFGSLAQAAPIVSNLTAAQRPGTKLVDITYDLAAPGFGAVTVTIEASSDGGTTWTVPVVTVTGAVGASVTPGTGKAIVWNAGADWPRSYTNQMWVRITVDDGFAHIPGGSFTMGRTSGDTDSNAPPITVTVSSFYLQQKETTKAQWDEVRTWAVNNGYSDLPEGGGKAADHPVHSVSWWDVVKWCNARSEKEGLTPVYTVSGAVMRTGTTTPDANWSANGYRLPTEAEWEKAARGGVSGKRFPWGTDTISHAQANYQVYSQNGTTNFYSYDVEPRPPATGTNYYHPSYTAGGQPYTSPVGSFGANEYGLYDMAGSVWEWCWDWYGASYYTTSAGETNPQGPASGAIRVRRGGSWSFNAFAARCGVRDGIAPGGSASDFGFRPARSVILDGIVHIPGGSFTMGRTSGDTDSNAPPITVTVSSFYLQQKETTKAQWDEVRTWAVNNGYTDLAVGAGKAANHPVQTVSWWDVVKWCNARSEKEGLTPVYTVSGAAMRTGTTAPAVNWGANGYRLPTEAEWEKAARGGVSGKRFPWGTDTISHAQANFWNNGGEAYATGTTGYHPSYTAVWTPYTSPVGNFAANGYGLYDMAGNVWEWCWDWYGGSYYTTSNGTTDPRGPASGSGRVGRGGSWINFAVSARCANRSNVSPDSSSILIGFRPARSSVRVETGNVNVDSRDAQTITFGPIPDKLTTDSVNLTATGGDSGNPVTFGVTSGPGIITNNVLTFTTSGAITITASQAGNDNYLAAEDVSRSFTVTKATTTVTLGSLAQVFNTTPRAATATTDPTGLTVEFTYDGSSTSPTNVGSYAVIATINDLIYQGSATGTLEIGKASQVITFAAIPDKLTTDSVNLTATGGNSGNPVTFTVTSGPGVITNNVLTFTTSGSVTITASQAGNDNYLAAEDVSRTFTVTKATSTIQFADLLQVDDGSPRSVSFTTDPEALPYDLLYADSETAPSLPGLYAVTASLEHPIHSGSGSATLTILGLSGRDQRLTSGSSQPQEANGTNLGRVILGRVATQTFTITNPGTNPVALTGSPRVEILGDHAGDFQVSVPPAAAIPAGGSVGFEVRFAPTQPGSRQAVVSLPCEALANGPITFAVGGLGAFPTMLAQTITFNLPASLFQSQGPVPLTATASSGLPVTLTVLSGPATLDAGELILNGLGTVKIEARQEGGGNFAAAKPVVRTMTVKADPTGLTLADLTQTYNGTPRPITVLGTEEEVTVEYFVNGGWTPEAPKPAGSYPVKATAGGVTKTGTLVIARAPLIVQVLDQRKLVGEANPTVNGAFTLSGFMPGDNELNSLLPRLITVTTKAKEDSPPGLYPITSSGGGALNYTLIHRPGTLVVEGYVGNFEALLRDPDTGLPVGLLKLTVPSTSQSLTASLALADQAKPLALAAPLELDPETRVATAQLSRIVNKTHTYQLDLTLSLFGELAVEVRKNDQLIAKATDGTRLRDAVKGENVPQMGAYTAVLEPAEDDAAPLAPGWATVKVDAAGAMALTGRLGDGTPFTASLPMDVSEGYRFFVQPYKRAGAHLGGAWSLTAHPEVADIWQARGVELTWVKGDNAKDPGYRGGFGPLAVTLEMDAWQPANKTLTLAQLLGTTELSVSHDSTGSDSEVLLANRVAVDPTGVLRVLAPVTNPPNMRKWTAKVNPATGAYSGSFELFDLTQKRKVNFSGVLRQSADAEADGLQGRGHYLLPPLKGATNTATTTGRMEFRPEGD